MRWKNRREYKGSTCIRLVSAVTGPVLVGAIGRSAYRIAFCWAEDGATPKAAESYY